MTKVQCINHKPVQHRDGKPPWCNTCGTTAGYVTPVSRFDKPDMMSGNGMYDEPNDPFMDPSTRENWVGHEGTPGHSMQVVKDDRPEAVRRAVQSVLTNASNFPEKVQTRILGQDMATLTDAVTDAVLAALQGRCIGKYHVTPHKGCILR